MVTKDNLREDIVAGITVAFIAIPLSLAIALASGVEPAVGLITAVVAGIACSLFGGTPLSVSGPAAAMAVLIASSVQDFGLDGLLVIGIGCGILQLLTGVFGLGKYVRLIPMPVVEGFTAGIGAIILIGQLPRALGLPPPPQSHVLDVLTHIRDLIHQTHPAALITALSTLALILGLPKISKKIPAPLLGVLVPSLVVALLRIDIPTIGAIPRSLPMPRLPSWPSDVPFGDLVGSMLLVYALASLETLLSASAVDKLVRGSRSDPDQELIGQGLGNIIVAFFRGIPVTGVIARSAANVQAGAKTRRASIIHSLVILITVIAFAPLMSRIPIAALAGLLLSVALRMLNPRKIVELWHFSKDDTLVYLTTFAVIVFVDLIEGVRWGVLAAIAIAAVRLGRTTTEVYGDGGSGTYRLEVQGPITFMSSLRMDSLRQRAERLMPGRGVVVDISGVTDFDASGAEMLIGLVDLLRSRGLKPVVQGADEKSRAVLLSADHDGELTPFLTSTEQEAAQMLEGSSPISPQQRLQKGVERFRKEHRPRYAELFERLARGQSPHTLFITCSDSRVSPTLLTSTDPGELFIVRNVGNMIPPCNDDPIPTSGGAAVDYAVGILGVREIVVCAHSTCGAIKALLANQPMPDELRSLNAWLKVTEVREMCRHLPTGMDPDEVARLNALAQLDHLRTYPIVRAREASGDLHLQAWFFNIGNGEVEIWSPEQKKFGLLGESDSAISLSPHSSPLSVS